MIKVITYGTYDLLHYGHIRLLERAKLLGDYLIVGITSDDYDKSRGKINNQQSLIARIAAVRETGIADKIIVEEYEGQKIDDIQRYDVDIFTVGSDWEGKFDYLNKYCKVIYLPRTEGVSSSSIRSDRRKLRLATIGSEFLCRKFIQEMQYVNGVVHEEYSEDLEGIDAVYIAITPPPHRYNYVKKALLKGKHVICESPAAMSVSECRELFKLAEDKKLILFDAIKTAYSMAYARLLLLAKSGKIGDIVSVDAVCTSLGDRVWDGSTDLSGKQNSICAWGPVGMLPVFQLLGTDYKACNITTRIIDPELNFDGFTRIDFTFDSAVASVKVAKAAKAEGELVITGSKGYIYVPAPWWKTDYFETRFEDTADNKRYFYQLDGEGIRYEIAAFTRSIASRRNNFYVSREVSEAIAGVIGKFNSREYTQIGA